jgi:hypothetical protein
MKYTVSIAIDGRIDVEVEADSFEEAELVALGEVWYCDFSTMDIIDTNAVRAEDENGNSFDY